MSPGLASRFLAGRGDVADVDPGPLEAAIADLLRRGRARFPNGQPDEALVEQLARNAELADGDVATAVAALGEEIVLAAACVLGDRAALEVLERDYGHQLRILVGSMVGDGARDIVQDVWARLLVAHDARPPRLTAYGGRGSLLTWLRVVVAREAVSSLRRRRDVLLDDEVLVGRLITSHDPGLELIRAQSAAEVKRAFEAAVASLTVRERNLLRQHLLDGLTIDELGALYRVHRTTAARWLTAARETAWTRTQQRLRERLQLSPPELASLLGGVRDWLDLSLERVL